MLLFRDVTVAVLTLLFTVMAKRVRDQHYTMAGLTCCYLQLWQNVFVTSVIQWRVYRCYLQLCS